MIVDGNKVTACANCPYFDKVNTECGEELMATMPVDHPTKGIPNWCLFLEEGKEPEDRIVTTDYDLLEIEDDDEAVDILATDNYAGFNEEEKYYDEDEEW